MKIKRRREGWLVGSRLVLPILRVALLEKERNGEGLVIPVVLMAAPFTSRDLVMALCQSPSHWAEMTDSKSSWSLPEQQLPVIAMEAATQLRFRICALMLCEKGKKKHDYFSVPCSGNH